MADKYIIEKDESLNDSLIFNNCSVTSLLRFVFGLLRRSSTPCIKFYLFKR